MPITVRTLLKSIVGLAVALLGPATKVMAQERSPAGSMGAFIAKLRADGSLRLRFQENPSAVMRAEGIDPTPYRLPNRLTQVEVDRLLADWLRGAGPAETPPPRSSETTPRPRRRSTALLPGCRDSAAPMSAGQEREPRYDGDPRKLARWRPDKDNPPSIAVWEITLRCDLGCRHCGSRAGRVRNNELNTAQALDLVHQLADLGLKEVTLIGGEFYMRDDWDRIAAEIDRYGMLSSIVTGARQMTDDRVSRAVAAGVGKISISIDGLERTHDAIRGSAGSWKAAVDAARRISASGIDLSVNTQMNRLTMPELPAVADLLVEIEARSWMVILTAAMGRAADRPSLLLQPYHLLYLFPLLAEIKRERLDPNGIAFFPGNNVGYFGPLAELLRYGGEEGYVWDGCGAGVAALGIEADGQVKGCPSLPTSDYARGNIRERPLRDIATQLRREKTETPVELWGFCKTCPFAARCKGGCTWTSHVLFGRPGNNPFCHSRALAMADAGVIETIELVTVAPGEPFDFGRCRIVEAPLGPDLEADPVIAMTKASQVFGLNRDAVGVWSKRELSNSIEPEAGVAGSRAAHKNSLSESCP